MDIVTYKQLKLYTNQKNILQPITVKQEDGLSRYLKITLMSDENVVELLDTDSVIINVKRSDNQSQAFSGSISDGIITVPIPAWLMKKTGRSTCSVSCFRLLGYELSTDTEVDANKTYYTESGGVYTTVTPDGTENPSALGWYEAQIAKLSSNAFYIDVQELEYDGEDISDDPNYNVLLNLIAQVQALEDAWQLLDPDGYVNQLVVNNNVVEFNNTDAGAIIGELHFATINGNDIVDENAIGDLQLFEKTDIDTSVANPTDNTKVLSEKAVVDNFIAKSDIDTTLANPTSDAKVLSEKAIATELDKKADIVDLENGQIEPARAKVAKALEPSSQDIGSTQETPFIYQAAGTENNTTETPVSPTARQLEKQGNTVVVNQWVNPAIIPATSTVNGVTFTNNNDGTITINGTATGGNAFIGISLMSNDLPSHKAIYNIGNGTNKKGNVTLYNGYNLNDPNSQIGDFYAYAYLIVLEGQQADNVLVRPLVSDLTQWFGSNDNIPAYLLSHPETFGNYYQGSLAYNTGTLTNSNGRYLVCGQSRNLWDEEWELGVIDTTTGQNSPSNFNIRSKNYIKVISNVTYRFLNGQYFGGILQYDQNKNFITDNWNGTTLSNCCYIRFFLDSSYGTTYKQDITISEYFTTGTDYDQYYPYVAPKTYDTGTEELKSAGDVKDTKAPDGTITRKVGSVDLGTLDWTGDGTANFFSNQILPNIGIAYQSICVRYSYCLGTYTKEGMPNKTIGFNYDGRLYLRDDDYTSGSDLKSSLSGVILYYELATPTTESGTPFTDVIEVNDYGFMAWLDTSENYVITPQGCKIFYPADLVSWTEDAFTRTNGDTEELVIQSELTTEATARSTQDIILQNAIGGTLRQCLCVKESLDFDNTDFVDLGTLNWVLQYTSGGHREWRATFATAYNGSASSIQNGLCSAIKSVSPNDAYQGGEDGITQTGTYLSVGETDSLYNDATAFKAAMKGVLYAYEKA